MWSAFVILFLLVFILAGTGLYVVGLYETLVDAVRWRADVLPAAYRLSAHVGESRTVLGELRGIRRSRLSAAASVEVSDVRVDLEGKFQQSLFAIANSFGEYRRVLEEKTAKIDRNREESPSLGRIERSLKTMNSIIAAKGWGTTDRTLGSLEQNLLKLQELTGNLPTELHREFKGYSTKTERQAAWLRATVLFSVTVSGGLMVVLIFLSYDGIFKPLKILIEGSRRIAGETAAGNRIQYQIELNSQDEMAELAEAMNQMTRQFEEIRRELDQKVQQRSRELIRSERLASVGFLAAGVAHEINNPLAAISTCAESLQRRIVPALEAEGHGETGIAKRYLKMIEEEAFRCKGITDKLLSFARSENKAREKTDLVTLVVEIVEMTRHREIFRQKKVQFDLPESLEIVANPQEMKQVVLNLVANAMHSTDPDGHIMIRLRKTEGSAVLTVRDDGSGMDEATLKNIFEPFFTRRQHGQGTGLGLSITHRIIEEHHGRIDAESDGPGSGATFSVEIPMTPPQTQLRSA